MMMSSRMSRTLRVPYDLFPPPSHFALIFQAYCIITLRVFLLQSTTIYSKSYIQTFTKTICLITQQRMGVLFSKADVRTSGSLTLHGMIRIPQMIGVPFDFNGISNTFPMQSIQTDSPGKELVNYCIDVPTTKPNRREDEKQRVKA